VSVMVETFGTEHVGRARIVQLVEEHFDLRPLAFRRELDLHRPIYQKTASGGHFGREDADFTWEQTTKADALRSAARMDRAGCTPANPHEVKPLCDLILLLDPSGSLPPLEVENACWDRARSRSRGGNTRERRGVGGTRMRARESPAKHWLSASNPRVSDHERCRRLCSRAPVNSLGGAIVSTASPAVGESTANALALTVNAPRQGAYHRKPLC